jgi:hypothetical protein
MLNKLHAFEKPEQKPNVKHHKKDMREKAVPKTSLAFNSENRR